MATPYDWMIDEIERKASAAADKHEVAALRGDVVRLESSVRELRADIYDLRAQLSTCQDQIIAGLQAQIDEITGADK